MRHHQLIVALFALASIAAGAAEREAVTLADGRTLVGVYDADAGTVTLDGKGSAVVKVRADQVKDREPAPAAPAPAAAKSATAAVLAGDPSAPAPARRQDLGRTVPQAIRDAEQARQKAKELLGSVGIPADGSAPDPTVTKALNDAKAAEQRRDHLIADMRHAVLGNAAAAYDANVAEAEQMRARIKDLERERQDLATKLAEASGWKPVDVKLSDDPTRSEQQRAERARAYNALLAQLRSGGGVERDEIFRNPIKVALVAEFAGP